MSKKLTGALALTTAALTALAMGSSGVAQADPPQSPLLPAGNYLVQLKEAPLSTYDGGTAGLKATKPVAGEKLNPLSAESKAYQHHLATKRADVARTVGAQQTSSMDVVLNGFSATLTAAQASRLAKNPGVAKLWENETLHADTYSTPAFLGLDGPAGVWQKQFGGSGHAGEGIIVADVDSGYTPQTASFGPLPTPRPDQGAIDAKWKQGQVKNGIDTRDGSVVCDAGRDDPAKAAKVICNNKVLGARIYKDGLLAGGTKIEPTEFDSPRDFTGHGSHTASTAAGNNGVDAKVTGADGVEKVLGKISGMAPAARLAIYKVCWGIVHAPGAADNSCSNIDSVAAINQAVLDGADVINFSISGSSTYVVDAVELAFLNAAQAGVFVSASAGNSGTEGPSKVAHNSPWLTTVAASTQERAFRKSVTLGNGKTYTGAGVGAAVPSTPLVDSVNVGLAGADATQVELCFNGTLDPAKVTGKMVLCKRGTNDRTDKSKAVKTAGGVGMVLYNPTVGNIAADDHSVPTVHVDNVMGAAIKAYVATAGATASLGAVEQYKQRAPEMADFSSYGPALAGAGNLLKPDITAPGVDIVAAVAPTASNNGQSFASYQGTSMSAPHITGIAALLKSANPKWTPSMVKSAIMTTASVKDNTGAPIQRLGVDATPLNFGAGHVVPGKAFDPGLVYDSGLTDWVNYICAIGQGGLNPDLGLNCADFPKINPSDANYPSISVGALAGSQTMTRTVTNATRQIGLYIPKIEAPPGTKVTVSPSFLIMGPGRSATFKVTVTRTTAAFGQYTFGALTWLDGWGRQVRSPLAIRPVPVSAAAELPTATGTDGSVSVPVRAGYGGTLTARPVGLVPATVAAADLAVDSGFNPKAPAASASVGSTEVAVAAGAVVARFATFDADYAPGADVDLYVYAKAANGALSLVGQSAGGTAEESVTLTSPAAGTYVAFFVNYAAPGGGATSNIRHYAWVVGQAAAGNLVAAPASQPAKVGGDITVTATWSGLTAGTRYLGGLVYGDGTQDLGQTLVSVTA